MNLKRLIAVILIYVAVAIAWAILGATNEIRSSDTYSQLVDTGSDESGGQRAGVQELWGVPQTQCGPKMWATHTVQVSKTDDKGRKVTENQQATDTVIPFSSRVTANIGWEPRQKGLVWYGTYKVRFAGDYVMKNEFSEKHTFFISFKFPAEKAIYDDVDLLVNGRRINPGVNLAEGVQTNLTLDPGQTADVHMSYVTQGMDTWKYQFSDDGGVTNVRDFEARIHTDCTGIDFPSGCVSPTFKTASGNGWDLTWKYANLVSGFNIGVAMPNKLNPGPFAARLSFFAPVSLFFFFAVLLIVGAVKDVRLHPMHYLFLACSFFSFHLLFSYTVDHLALFSAFLVSSAVSMLLVISYMRLAVNWRFALFQAGVWQFVFLVLFAYAFFFEGYTGLTITVGAILTLAVLMQMTGRINWEEKLGGKQG